ncbi:MULTISPECIES: type VI secretion system tube protein TssD [unclassified Pseudomonas]|uniref:type VI secretion system tube protein TssD n=1 Tax=unclassified Pseudomonas TaxID=196821 RepID=UPI001CBC4B77|nr:MULTISPECIES: type VI secretion system tube protein TssD [unclassified Pseudomonas]
MANPIYAWLKDKEGKEIKGSVTVHGREGSIEVLSQQHGLTLPYDPSSGKASGLRVHTPFVFTKALDSSSTLLLKALSDNKELMEATFKWYDSSKGEVQEVEYYRVVLKDVRVVSIQAKTDNFKDPASQNIYPMEEIQLAYREIEWTFVEGNLIHDDKWDTRQTS